MNDLFGSVKLVIVMGTTLLATDTFAQTMPRIERFKNNPIIVPTMLPGADGENINGPSVIEVPSWIDDALGRYYLYFAHHAGSYIRMAYANDLAGPWRVYEPGTLQIEDTVCNEIFESRYADYRHVASPDVHVDNESQQIRMYFHCPVYIAGSRADDKSYKQVTLLAMSPDGLKFRAGSEPLGNSYFRVFHWDDMHYALGMPGVFYRSADGLTVFEEGPTLFTKDQRHTAVKVNNGKLLVLYTVVGENPERILLSEIDLGDDWMKWKATEPRIVLEPETEWEGANLEHKPSVRGFSMKPVRQLRDPALFEVGEHSYLFYSVAGESGIAIAEIDWDD